MRGLNLIPAPRIEARRLHRRGRAWCMSCGLYALTLAVTWAAVYVARPNQHAALAQQIDTLATQAADDRADAAALGPRLSDAITTLAANRTIGNQPDWSMLLGLVANLLGEEAVLRSCRLDPVRPVSASTQDPAAAPRERGRVTRYRLHLEGLGKTQGVVLGYVRDLEQTQLFESVTVIQTRGEPFHNEQAVAFTIECALVEHVEGGAP